MKEKKNLIICGIILLIIMVGMITTFTLKLNVSLDYMNCKRISVYIGGDVDTKEIKEMTTEVFGTKKVVVQKIEVFNDMIAIKVESIPEGAMETLTQKINEKYGTEYTQDDYVIEDISSTRIRDLIKPYTLPLILSIVLIVIYFGIRYRTLGMVPILIQLVGTVAIIEALYVSILAIVRIPISGLTIPIGLIILVVALVILTCKNEKRLTDKSSKDNKNKKAIK